MEQEDFEQLREELLAGGYLPYIDPLDAETVSEYPCDNCGDDRVYGHGFRKDHTYRCFAVCEQCGYAQEF